MFDIWIFVALVSTIGLIILSVFVVLRPQQNNQQTLVDFERRITDLLMSQVSKIQKETSDTSLQMSQRIASFTKETTELKQAFLAVEDKVGKVASFQELFKAPKLRGQWGEQQLGYLMRQYFPEELIFEQYRLSPKSEDKVDCAFKLPDGKILPIDSKFSLENFIRMVEEENQDKKTQFKKLFIVDVKKRIDEIASKYIQPSEGTVDFALMYIPAEAVYYELFYKQGDNDALDYARNKKVIVCSPNTLYLSLKTVMHWVKDTQISKHTQTIIKRLARINIDAEKLDDSFRKLGMHLKNAQSSYGDSQDRLSKFSDRVNKVIDMSDENDKNLLE